MTKLVNPLTAVALVAIPVTKAGVTPSWAYIKLCLTILLQAMGYTVNLS